MFILGVHRGRAEKELVNTPDQILDSVLQTYLPLLALKCPSVDTWKLLLFVWGKVAAAKHQSMVHDPAMHVLVKTNKMIE